MDTPVVGKMPTHRLIAATDDYKNKVSVGTLWLKSGDYGNYLSGEMQTAQSKDGKVYPAYVIVEENYIKQLQLRINELENAIPSQSAFTPEEAEIINNARAQHMAPKERLTDISYIFY